MSNIKNLINNLIDNKIYCDISVLGDSISIDINHIDHFQDQGDHISFISGYTKYQIDKLDDLNIAIYHGLNKIVITTKE